MQQQIAKHLGALGIHAKLTIWYTLIFTVLIILFAAIFYLHLRNVLFSNLDTQLQLRAQLVEGAITEHRGELTLHDATGRLFTLLDADDPSQQSILHKEHGLTAQQLDPDLDVLIQVRNTAGHVQYTTPAFTLLTPPAASIQQALHGQTGQNTFTARNGQHVRVYSQPIVYQHRPIGIVLVGIPLSQQESTLHHVLFELLLVGPMLLLLGMIVSFWLTKRALRPITRLTGIARTIQEGDLRSRVPLPRSNDEVHLLAETFNEMIDHLEALFYQQRRFLSDASHELRTPIAALRSMTDVALSQPRSVEEYATLLQDINGQSEHLGRLITDL
jgi:methyl-accepting chemotaxis protein